MRIGLLFFIIIAVLVGTAVFSPSARAELVTISLEAVVDSVQDGGSHLEGKIVPGDIIIGSYTYDLSVVDSNPSSSTGVYEHLMGDAGMSLSVSGFEFAGDPASPQFFVEARNNYMGLDAYWFISVNNIPVIDGIRIGLYWILEDHTATTLGSDALPRGGIALDDYDYNVLSIIGGDWRSGGIFAVEGHVTSAVVAVPEPATVLLLGIGAMALFRRRKRE